MKWKIGNIEINNQVILAPMAGISNPAYMKICEEMGVGCVVTELISAEAIVRNNKKTLDMLKGIESLNIPVGVQIFGSDEVVMAKAASLLTDLYKNIFIDINMGCPVPKVAIKSQAGSALLKNPEKIRKIVSSVVKAVTVPVTVKIRSGWDSSSINAVEVAKICEEAGAKAIAVHPRTRSQGYSGVPDWSIIKMVKENVLIPVIGNGNIVDIESAKKMFEITSCDAIMIGRGCLGNPWLIKELVLYLEKGIVSDKPTYEEKIVMCFRHMDYLSALKGVKVCVLEMRSHIAWYLKGMPKAGLIKQEIMKANSIEEVKKLLNCYLNELKNSI
jgi:nifR3 family TIM-barrel protein